MLSGDDEENRRSRARSQATPIAVSQAPVVLDPSLLRIAPHERRTMQFV